MEIFFNMLIHSNKIYDSPKKTFIPFVSSYLFSIAMTVEQTKNSTKRIAKGNYGVLRQNRSRFTPVFLRCRNFDAYGAGGCWSHELRPGNLGNGKVKISTSEHIRRYPNTSEMIFSPVLHPNAMEMSNKSSQVFFQSDESFLLLVEKIRQTSWYGKISHHVRGFIHPRLLFGISEPSSLGKPDGSPLRLGQVRALCQAFADIGLEEAFWLSGRMQLLNNNNNNNNNNNKKKQGECLILQSSKAKARHKN